MMNTIQCPHCKKIFFQTESNFCPFCKKDITKSIDAFKDLFGKDNPFKDLMGEK